MDPAAPLRKQRAARVVLLDENDRALLIRFEITRRNGGFTFWATPGGGLEADEDPLTAARRELLEELGLDLVLTGPIHEARAVFEHEGAPLENTDIFFLARCEASAPRLIGLDEAERQVMCAIRWWTADEIAASNEAIFPPDLAELIRRVGRI
ncbi:NUDIX domain-containing protein [Caulobacter sp. RL271]|jgi:8-oxo-dGTP pyrophosphatase MutT (NUDIX family)|uniref:NUDIX domain-containing protein n=1 Tax=Caulobacter segnis TaxID=88688 RepID=A0ABY4ZZM3_9CAUL|nr:NUDIX domain-containing protein [Caulobacter segnis]USQ98163.1 NUDIX domain-containing protein [Caulobacter segnis]